jgi:hypothetical protein
MSLFWKERTAEASRVLEEDRKDRLQKYSVLKMGFGTGNFVKNPTHHHP